MPTAAIIDGKSIAAAIRGEVRVETDRLFQTTGKRPGLAFVLVGDHPSSQSYVGMKEKACTEAGFFSLTERLPAATSEKDLLDLLGRLNDNADIHGILVQLPLPSQIDESRILVSIDPRKDVDGFHPENVGKLVLGQDTYRPCTPAGIQELLMRSGNDPSGKHVVIVGRSNIVGKPVANLLLQKQKGANAVVTVVHTGAKSMDAYLKQADILIAAIGRPEAIHGEQLKPGCVVIDVGINRVEDPSVPKGYRIVGDVHFASASRVASAISPVPGGVGPMTIAMLLKNTLKGFKDEGLRGR